MSSWIVNPLGILVAQGFGVANSPIVILVLLATGACVPFQLLMNECIAATDSRGIAGAGRSQIGLLLCVQVVTCAATIYGLSAQRFPPMLIAIVIVLLAINTGLSYRVSLRYYRLLTLGVVSLGAAAMIGAIPGVISLLLYVAYAIAAHNEPQTATGFIVVSTMLPTLVQWRYLKSYAERAAPASLGFNTPHARLVTGWLISSGVALAGLAAASTLLRETVAQLSANHLALLLVALNSILSLINTATRAAFLNAAGGGQKLTLTAVTVTMVMAGAYASASGWHATPVILLGATQLAIAWVIEAARRIPISKAACP